MNPPTACAHSPVTTSDRTEPGLLSAPRRVLVVDDEAHVRALFARRLGDAGYRCAQADDCAAAWRRLKQGDIELVLLDHRMPGKTGIEFLPEIKQAFPDVEVILLTAMIDTSLAIAALTSGAYGYLIKPVHPDELLAQARKAIERRDLLLARRRHVERLEEQVRRQTLTIRRAHEETIHRLLAATQSSDEETAAHVRRTGFFSEALARAAGWSPDQAEQIRLAAPMHDIGKISVPDAILKKPGKLAPKEFEVMKRHTAVGAAVLAGSDSPMLQMACRIARSHHERWDGAGYLDGLAGARIPQSARIVAIVDVYDALTHDRVYRPAFAEDEALAMMRRGRGEHFDPDLLDAFFDALPVIRRIAAEYPDERQSDPSLSVLDALAAAETGLAEAGYPLGALA